jgi:hypothetical protein
MQALIRDLLAYSRVGTRADGFTPIECELVLADVLDGYLTRKAAKRDFGVAITPRDRINQAQTARLRDAAS